MVQKRSHVFLERLLIMPGDLSPWRTILIRAGFLLLIFVFLTVLLWFDRDGLRDHADDHISFPDVLYFTMVTITTVGYGDIVPVTPRSRMIDAFIITPVRIFILLLFFGTAYQLAIKQFAEGYRMAKLKASLNQHLIICGIGHTGWATIKELLGKGTNPDEILAIDTRDDCVRAAAELGTVAIRGDATHEGTLRDAALDTAKAVILTTGRDDTNTLILLTIRHMYPHLRVLVSAKEEENVKLLQQAGANTIITPATFGGSMLAAAVDQIHLARYMEDLLTSGGRVNLTEEKVKPDEIGKTPWDFLPDMVLRIYRQGRVLPIDEFRRNEQLQEGDILLLLKQRQKEETHIN